MRKYDLDNPAVREKVQKALDTLEEKASDKITEMKGTITVVSFHHNGCIRIALHPKAGADNKIADGLSADIQDVVLDPTTILKTKAASETGGPSRDDKFTTER